MDVARLNFSHGTPRAARRDRRSACAPPRPRRAPGGDPPGPARAQAAHRRARGRHGRAQAGRDADASSAAPTRSGDGERDVDLLGRAGRARSTPTRSSTSPTARSGCASTDVRDGDGEVDDRGRDRRLGRLPPGPQHPRRRAALPAVPEEDLDHAALRRADRRRPRGAVVRAHAPRTSTSVRKHTRLPLIAKIEKPQAVERAEEIIARRRLRDGRPRRPRDRAADRGRADRPEAAARASPAALARPVDHRDADARLDGRLLAPDPRRGRRRRQRDPRRHRRGDALPGDRGGRTTRSRRSR